MQHSEGHTKPVCQICGKDFWTRGDLRVHIKRHMNRGERGGGCRWSCVGWNSVGKKIGYQKLHITRHVNGAEKGWWVGSRRIGI